MFKDQITLKYFKGVQFGEAERESFTLFEVLKQTNKQSHSYCVIINAHRHIYEGIRTTIFFHFPGGHLCTFLLDQESVYWAGLTNRIQQRWCWNSFQAQILAEPSLHFAGTLTLSCSYGKLSQPAMRRCKSWGANSPQTTVSNYRSTCDIKAISDIQSSWAFNIWLQ